MRRICSDETDRARRARIDECFCIKRDNWSVSQLLSQIQELQNNVNSLSDARKFYLKKSSSEATTFPVNPFIPSPRTMLCCDSGLLHDTQNFTGTSGFAQEGQPSTFLKNSKNLTSSGIVT